MWEVHACIPEVRIIAYPVNVLLPARSTPEFSSPFKVPI
jgi:hypothetical protein